ncbi:MAG: type II toxin-antitoxin system VapC family toxin [Dehalococcoidia bacterium]
MSVAYFDASAAAKLYLNEIGSREVGFARERCERAVTSQLTTVEVVSAVARAFRTRRIDQAETDRLTMHAQIEFGSLFDLLPVTLAVIDQAARLVPRHGLRAYDAVQLATALDLRVAAEGVLFVVADSELAKAARAEGFDVPAIPRG